MFPCQVIYAAGEGSVQIKNLLFIDFKLFLLKRIIAVLFEIFSKLPGCAMCLKIEMPFPESEFLCVMPTVLS